MGFLDKVVDVLGFVEREEIEEEEVVERPAAPVQKQNAMPVKSEPKPVARINNVVSFTNPNREHSSRTEGGENARVVLVEPVRFEESQGIADNLLEHKAVVINIESCDTDIAAKIIDFVGGVVYAIDGTIQKVSQGIILAAPQNIDIASELKHDMADTDEEIFAWITQYNRRGDF
ncbi:MAG: cell division protein SepF [Peptococcaceae bacterium]|nr:cell division protein SepF [Peptococcaceae bacterium]MBQ3509785.1 cell division protein SepF [Peptococcaceae bacterium]MBR2627209.1 cell division protein SepF [Peptococcaceae bacterium]